jgi:excisionase family DNA binding protein
MGLSQSPKLLPQLPLSEFLLPEEVASLLQVSRLSVLRWAKSGDLPAIKLGFVGRLSRLGRRRKSVQAVASRSVLGDDTRDRHPIRLYLAEHSDARNRIRCWRATRQTNRSS